MNFGRIEQIGPPRELYDRPQSRYVADFIGETNLIPAGDGAWLSVRPEVVVLGSEGRSAKVTSIVYAGAVVKTSVRLDNGTELVSQQAAHQPARSVGETVQVQWPADQAVVVRD